MLLLGLRCPVQCHVAPRQVQRVHQEDDQRAELRVGAGAGARPAAPHPGQARGILHLRPGDRGEGAQPQVVRDPGDRGQQPGDARGVQPAQTAH